MTCRPRLSQHFCSLSQPPRSYGLPRSIYLLVVRCRLRNLRPIDPSAVVFWDWWVFFGRWPYSEKQRRQADTGMPSVGFGESQWPILSTTLDGKVDGGLADGLLRAALPKRRTMRTKISGQSPRERALATHRLAAPENRSFLFDTFWHYRCQAFHNVGMWIGGAWACCQMHRDGGRNMAASSLFSSRFPLMASRRWGLGKQQRPAKPSRIEVIYALRPPPLLQAVEYLLPASSVYHS